MCKQKDPISLEQLFITLFGKQLFTSTSSSYIRNEQRCDDDTPDECSPVHVLGHQRMTLRLSCHPEVVIPVLS